MIKLYGYQEEAVDAMYDKPGFLLGDDMGVGKTYTALEEIAQWSEAYRKVPNVLVVGPKTALDVWEDSIPNIMPQAFVTYDDESYDGGFLLINYEALFKRKRKGDPTYKRLDVIDSLRKPVFDYIIADEAHRIKNRKAKQTRALKKIKGMHKRALTGTPIINRPDELWSILNWLYPNHWRSYWAFFERYVSYDIGYPAMYKIVTGPKNTNELQKEIAHLFMRRTKEEVLRDLPEKYYTYIKLDMTPKQAKAYKEMKEEMVAWLDQQPDEVPLLAPTILAQLTRLRQFAGSYGYVDDAGTVHMDDPSNKIDALVELVEDASSPVVVFSQFTQLVELASDRLTAHGISNSKLTGKTANKDRPGIIKSFSRGELKVLLANIQTGGVGIDGLQDASSTVIFLDRAWSPAYNHQAEDRLHRNGQTNAVQVIVLQSRSTVDLVIEERLEQKKSWVLKCLGR